MPEKRNNRFAIRTYQSVIALICLFVVYLLYMVFLTDILYPFLPNRFPAPMSLCLYALCVLICSGGFLYLKRFDFHTSYLRRWQICLFFFTVAFSVSLPLVLFSAIEPKSDFYTYYEMARKLSIGEVFIPDYVAVFPHTIAFPAVLSLVFRCFGPSVKAAQFFGVCLSSLSVMLVYLVGEITSDRKYGIGAAALWLFMPSRVLYTLLVCTENLFNVLALAAILIFILAVKAPAAKRSILLFAASGLLFALLVAVRPNGLILLIACVLFYLFFFGKDERLKIYSIPVMKITGFVIVAAVYLFTSAMISKAIEAKIGEEIAPTKAGWNLYVGMNEESDGRWNSADSSLFGQLLREKGPEGTQSTLLSMGIERLKINISDGTLIPFLFEKMRGMWYADHEAYDYIAGAQADNNAAIHFDTNNKLIKLLSDGYYYMLLLLAVYALIHHIRKKDFYAAILIGCLFILGTIALHIPFEAALRYKNHAVLWLCLLAASIPETFYTKGLSKK